jgi:Glycosyl hydrolases family 28
MCTTTAFSSCQDVLIEYVHIACGDDHIAIKAGVCGTSSPNNCTDKVWSSGIYQTSNVTVRHSTFGRGMGIAIGSEMSGGIQNVQIYNNTIGLCDTGSFDPNHACGWGPALHIKTTIARGGFVRNVSFYNNTVWNTSMFILLEIGYQTSRNELPPMDYEATKVHDISFISNRAVGSAKSATFYCSIYDLCHNVTIIDNIIAMENLQYNPWNCHFVAFDYIVTDNCPPGLEECMANSTMNITASLDNLNVPGLQLLKSDIIALVAL